MRSNHKNNYNKYYHKYPNFQDANLKGVIFVDFLEQCLNYQRNYSRFHEVEELSTNLYSQRYYRDGILVFRGANCQGAKFAGVEEFVLEEAEFQSAKCQEANFESVNLRRAQFQGADLRNANLKYTILRGARLEGANLRNTNLQFADFHECTLDGAKLQGANLAECKDWNIGAKWLGAEYDDYTIFPNDFIPEYYGLIKKPTTKQSNDKNRQARSNNTKTLQQKEEQFCKKACIEIKKYIQNRQGQAEFRRDLLKRYDCRCAITGCSIIGVLEAAHVKPYSVSQQENQPENGILLRADLHTLFDLNIIVIHPVTKKIEIRSDFPELDKMLRISEYQKFNGLVLPSYEEFGVCPDYEYLKWRYDNYGKLIKKHINVEDYFTLEDDGFMF